MCSLLPSRPSLFGRGERSVSSQTARKKIASCLILFAEASAAAAQHNEPETPPPPRPDLRSPIPEFALPSPSYPGFANGRPPGSFALPGIHSVAAAAAARSKAKNPDPESGYDNHSEMMNQSGATTRNIYSPDSGVPISPLNGGMVTFPGMKNERPSTLGSVIGVNPAINNNNNANNKGKKTRWLLCYPSGGAANSESPSPPHEEAPGAGSNVSTPSPTDGGFKIPNSQSNERPTSLPVALLNSSQRNGEISFEKKDCKSCRKGVF